VLVEVVWLHHRDNRDTSIPSPSYLHHCPDRDALSAEEIDKNNIGVDRVEVIGPVFVS